ncbi:MAG: hypothetical protein QNJ31_00300 [Candidatus Caenarcaniphilales bacterium]|nr:hypothetical protein [Candidatus Caenarcaniphilales bacterium]
MTTLSNLGTNRFNSFEDRLLNDIMKLTQPGGIEAVFNKAQNMSQSTFENSNFSTPTDVFGNSVSPGNPIPFGNFITDTYIGRDTKVKSDAIQQEREYLRQLYSFLTTNDYRGIASLLKDKLKLPESTANQLGLAIFNALQQAQPLFLSALEQQDQRLASTQDNLNTLGNLSSQRKRQNDQVISEIVQSIGNG